MMDTLNGLNAAAKLNAPSPCSESVENSESLAVPTALSRGVKISDGARTGARIEQG